MPTKEADWILEVTNPGEELLSRQIAERVRTRLGEKMCSRTVGGVISHQLERIFEIAKGDTGEAKTWRRIE